MAFCTVGLVPQQPLTVSQRRLQHLVPPRDVALGLSLPQLQIRELINTTNGAAILPVSQRPSQAAEGLPSGGRDAALQFLGKEGGKVEF